MPMPVRPAYHLYRWMWGSLDLLFPPECGGCGKRGSLWCDDCRASVRKLGSDVCDICGQPWEFPGLCFYCEKVKPHFSQLRSWAIYAGPVREAIQRLKYKRDVSLGIVFTNYLYDVVAGNGWQVEGVVPVPLGVARLQERGYNQAVLIARPLALRIGIPCLIDGLIRVRETRSQVGLSFFQRQRNVERAFQGVEKIISARRVLLVDDVATSSSTMNACAGALLAAGAQDVLGLTLARAI
jgi:ComF family protein